MQEHNIGYPEGSWVHE